jgi:hypothetical protein
MTAETGSETILMDLEQVAPMIGLSNRTVNPAAWTPAHQQQDP